MWGGQSKMLRGDKLRSNFCFGNQELEDNCTKPTKLGKSFERD